MDVKPGQNLVHYFGPVRTEPLMVGPADLSIALGIPGEFENPRLIEAVDRIRESCVKHGVAPGIHIRSVALAKFWRDRGMKFLSTGSETGFLFDASRASRWFALKFRAGG